MTQLEMTKQANQRSYIANYILAAAAVLFLLTYPFRDLFWGGLLSHLSGAAVIGGLADWYAVTALFKKPLGISFKTALIPRSKERIAETARYMLENEILTVPNMYKVLKSHPVLDAGLDYLHSPKGFMAAEQVLGQVLNTFLYTVDMSSVVKTSADLGAKSLEKFNLAPVLGQAMKVSLKGEACSDFLDFTILTVENVAKSDTMKRYLAEIYRESLRQYEQRNFIYALVVKAALATDIFGPDNVSDALQQKVLAILDEAKEKDSPYRKQAQQFLWKQAELLQMNSEWLQRMEEYKVRFYKYMTTGSDMSDSWKRYIQNPARQRRLCNVAASYLVGCLEEWQKSDMKVEQLNRAVLAMAARELKRLQNWFGSTAEKEIMQYDSEVLAAQLQNKVWNDLQMIRVNGSLVGALLGTVIFLIMYGTKGGW